MRLPDEECAEAQEFVKPRGEFWKLIQQTWDGVLTGEKMFSEKGDAGSMSRYSKTMKLEGEFTDKDLNKAEVRKEAQEKLKKVFEDSRKN